MRFGLNITCLNAYELALPVLHQSAIVVSFLHSVNRIDSLGFIRRSGSQIPADQINLEFVLGQQGHG